MIKALEKSPDNIRPVDFDFRKDLHLFVEYVRLNEIKRKTRGNDLNKVDVKRIAKWLEQPSILEAYERYGYSSWLDFVDSQALNMGFVSYNTVGEYRGWSSSEPSFTDNYIRYEGAVYEAFVDQPAQVQERQLLEKLLSLGNYSTNEFLSVSPVGYLDAFSSFGSAVGVLPQIKFADVRLFLLNQLNALEVGVWYEMREWRNYLKAEHRYFLIPESTVREKPQTGYSRKPKALEYVRIPRYGSLYESQWGRREIPDDAPDGFERVEGRYLERFLEYIPLLMGYVELADDPQYRSKQQAFANADRVTDRDVITAFRVTPLLKQVLADKLVAPRLTVQPNFELVIESQIYPVGLLRKLVKLGKLSQSSHTTSIKLDKQAVAAAVAANPDLDVIGLLETHSDRPLPQNVRAELQEWVQRADVFTLYHGLELVEDYIGHELVRQLASQQISEQLYLVPKARNIAEQLQQVQKVVLRIAHTANEIQVVVGDTQTVFPSKVERVLEAEWVVVQQETQLSLTFPQRAVLDAVRQGLLDARCPVVLNNDAQSLSFPQRYQAELAAVIASLTERYRIEIQEI